MASLSLTQVAQAGARELGVLDSGEGLSTQQLSDALDIMNNTLDNLSSEQLFIPALTRQTISALAATQTYVLGGTRPVAIIGAHGILAAGPSYPIEVISNLRWTSLLDREAQSFLVKYLFYDRSVATPTVYLSPVPIAALTVEWWGWTALAQFPDTTTPVAFAPGYNRFIELLAAIQLAPSYDMQPSPQVLQNYADAAARVRNLNAELVGNEPPAGQIGAVAPQAQVAPNQGAQ